jgi:type I restriction enzyme S subunit
MSQYKAYPAYKDSGVEWIGQVPEHWEVKPICRVTSVNDDALSDSTTGSTRISYVDISSVGYTEGIKQATEMAFEDAPSRARRKASTGDVVVSTVRTYLKAVAAVTDEYADCIFSTGFAVLRARQLEQSFLKWMILNELLVQAIEAHSEGLSYPAINASALVKLKSVIPPPDEQATIAATLDRETARIDALIQKKTRFIELLKEKRQALITHAVTKGLVPNVKMKDSGVEWIGQVPEHWEVKRLRHVGRYSNSGVDKKSYEDQQTVELCNYTDVYYNEFISDDMPFMQATASTREIEQFTLKKGDVIITKDSEDPSDIGIPAFVPHDMPGVICGYHLTMIRALNDNYGSYIHRSLQSDHTKAHFFVESPGITRYGLNQNTIGNAPVALPPPDEQATIAATLDRETARIDALIGKAEQSITLLKERRSAFITAAVTGQIDLRGEQ